MAERYDASAAAHYAAYRPPLHEIILQRVLPEDASFSAGLDVGCGTGYSALALARYCERVYAVDPSPSMLSNAAANERIDYLEGAAEHVPLPDRSVELVTFAGSLFYADPDATSREIRRVARDGAVIVVYDFEVLLNEVLQECGVDPQASASDYDHRVNFSGVSGFVEVATGNERIGVQATVPELAHVLLSDSNRLDRFAQRYDVSDPFPTLVGELSSMRSQPAIEADIYYSMYHIPGL